MDAAADAADDADDAADDAADFAFWNMKTEEERKNQRKSRTPDKTLIFRIQKLGFYHPTPPHFASFDKYLDTYGVSKNVV